MTGLASVKKAILQLTRVLEENYSLELRGREPMEVSLNRCFLGNPGTGKTTVAKLYGQILRHLGILSKGELMVKATSDFIGAAIGQSEKQTRAILEAAQGSVLIIDEAYGLNPKGGSGSGSASSSSGDDPYRRGAVDTLVELVHNKPGDDRCVLMLGYRTAMERLFNDANEGLKRRMGWSASIEFEDFTADELVEIFNGALGKRSLRAASGVSHAVADILEKQKRQPNFGNAGAVMELLNTAVQARAGRLDRTPEPARSSQEHQQLLLEDVIANQPKARTLDEIFSGLIGNEGVKDEVRKLKATIEMAKRRGVRDAFADVPMNFLFLGPPGTGQQHDGVWGPRMSRQGGLCMLCIKASPRFGVFVVCFLVAQARRPLRA
jgi:SpoVK/Ycf46/Vps4 family AAA+-type ATPase